MNLGLLSKRALLRAGAHSSEKTLHYVNGLLDYLELGWWLRRHDLAGGITLPSCAAVYAEIAAGVGERPVLYLQFGADDPLVVERWVKLLPSPETRLHVFAPTGDNARSWIPARGRGHRWEDPVGDDAAERQPSPRPRPDDARVRHFEGPMEAILDSYEWDDPEIVIAMLDTDYYSSTSAALGFVGDRLPVGSYLFFDQLNHRADELRALHEFLLATEQTFEAFAHNREFSCVAIRRKA